MPTQAITLALLTSLLWLEEDNVAGTSNHLAASSTDRYVMSIDPSSICVYWPVTVRQRLCASCRRRGPRYLPLIFSDNPEKPPSNPGSPTLTTTAKPVTTLMKLMRCFFSAPPKIRQSAH